MGQCDVDAQQESQCQRTNLANYARSRSTTVSLPRLIKQAASPVLSPTQGMTRKLEGESEEEEEWTTDNSEDDQDDNEDDNEDDDEDDDKDDDEDDDKDQEAKESVEELFKVEDIEYILTPVSMEDKSITHLRIIDDAFPMESWKETENFLYVFFICDRDSEAETSLEYNRSACYVGTGTNASNSSFSGNRLSHHIEGAKKLSRKARKMSDEEKEEKLNKEPETVLELIWWAWEKNKIILMQVWRHQKSRKFALSVEGLLIGYFGIKGKGGNLINQRIEMENE